MPVRVIATMSKDVAMGRRMNVREGLIYLPLCAGVVACRSFPGRSLGAILTGMGNDGTQGLRLLKRSGCSSIAQDEASCVVFGMPREAIHAGVVDTVVPLNRIADTLVRFLAEGHA